MSQQTPLRAIWLIVIAKPAKIFDEPTSVSFHNAANHRSGDWRCTLFQLRPVDQTQDRLGAKPLGHELIVQAADELTGAAVLLDFEKHADVATRR